MADASLFEINLTPIVDEGGELRVKNRDGNEVQRIHLVDRTDALVVQADLVDVVHGKLSEKDAAAATLIVLDFTFLPNKHSRRFKKAVIDIHFGDEAGRLDSGPDIEDIAPRGHLTMRPTNRHVRVKRSASAQAQGGGGIASVSAGFAWETTISQEKEDHTTLTGIVRYEARPFGGKNAARWTLLENETRESGIPAFLRTLILLRRSDSEQFTATVNIETEVDWKSSLTSLFGKKDKDDPVIFDPDPEAQPWKSTWARDNSISVDNLESTQLDYFSIILNTTMRKDVEGA